MFGYSRIGMALQLYSQMTPHRQQAKDAMDEALGAYPDLDADDENTEGLELWGVSPLLRSAERTKVARCTTEFFK